MQRKSFHLAAVALLALGVVISVIGGVGERFTAPEKRAEAPKPAPPPPKTAPDPAAPPWTFAPRRPIEDTPATGIAGVPGASGTPASPGAPGTPGAPLPPVAAFPPPGAPGTPGGAPFGAPGSGSSGGFFANDPRTAPGRPGNLLGGAPGTALTPGPPTSQCPRGTLVRAGSSGPEVFCAP